MTSNTYEIYYDEESDFLEIFFGDSSSCHTEEFEEGVFVRKDIETNEVKSIGILSFEKRTEVLKKILERFNKKLPRMIDISK